MQLHNKILTSLVFVFAANLAYAQCPPGTHAPYGASFCVAGNGGPDYPSYIPSREEVVESMVVRTMPDPMVGRVNAMTQVFELQAESLQRLQSAIKSDPKIRKLTNGWWEYFDSDKNQPPSFGCAAAYVSLNGIVMLSEVTGYKEAVITFIGPSIPRPESPTKVTALVDQDDGNPQNIKMLNYAVPNSTKLGAISLEVPTVKLLLDTMEEKQSFEISIDNHSLIQVIWKNGKEARDQLRKCSGIE